MTTFTEQFTRLRDEIVGARDARWRLNEALTQDAQSRRASVSGMMQEFARAHAEMAEAGRESRAEFVNGIREFWAANRLQAPVAPSRRRGR